MTVRAELHDGRILEFPDGTDPMVVQNTVKRMIAGGSEVKQPERTSSAIPDLSDSGFAVDEAQRPQFKDPEPGVEVPEWGIKNPNLYGMYGAGKAVLNQAVFPVVEDLAAVGGALMTPTMPMAGGALAYGTARQITDVAKDYYNQLGGTKPKDRTVLGDLGKRANEMSAMITVGKAFESAGPALEIVSKYVFDDLPRKLYSSAVKMPLDKKWTKVLPGNEVSKRAKAINEGLSENIPPSEFGIAKIKQLKSEAGSKIDDALNLLSENPELKIKVSDVVNSGLKKAYAEASVSSNPSEAKAIVDKIRDGFLQHGEFLNPRTANDIKIQIRNELASNAYVTGGKGLDDAAKKGISHEIMIRLESIWPEIKDLNRLYDARRSLQEAIESATGRIENRDYVGLGAKVLLTKSNPTLAAAESILGVPKVKARIAFLLAKANPKKYSKFVYPEMPAGYVPPSEAVESIVYRYAPETKFTKSTIPPPLKTIIRDGETPQVVINKSQALREAEEAERLARLEEVFGEFEKKKVLAEAERARVEGLRGQPLMTPSSGVVKSTIPPPLEYQLRMLNQKGLMR